MSIFCLDEFQVDTHKVLMKESGVNLTLTVVDTPGFGDAVDNSGCWDPVTQYVEAQYESFLDAETRVNRVTLPDGRVSLSAFFTTNRFINPPI